MPDPVVAPAAAAPVPVAAPAAVVPPAAAAPAAPAPATVPVKLDPITGAPVPIYAGADPVVETVIEGDRGDVVVAPPAAAVPAPVVAVPEPVPAAPVVDPAAAPVEPARDDKGRFIPKERFDEVNNRRKAAEDRLAAIDREKTAAAAAATSTYDFDAKEKQYAELVIDGKVDDAIALRKEIRAAERSQFTAEAAQQAVAATQAKDVQTSVDTVAAKYTQQHEEFNPESDKFNETMVDDVESYYTGFLQTGRFKTAAEAFERAINLAMKEHGVGQAAPAAAAPAVVPTAAVPAVGNTAAARVAAIAAQPPLAASVGTPGADAGMVNVNVQTLTAEDFEKLPPATRARLRGDVV